jgi:hypothetical protein
LIWRSDGALPSTWIQFGVTGAEGNVHSRLCAKLQVAFQITRVFGKILHWSKLRWIDVNAHDDLSVPAHALQGFSNQTQVTVVQIAHRRHETDFYASSSPLRGETLHFDD